MLADRYPNYSICRLPYFISGDVPDWRSLAHRTTDELEKTGIELLVEHKAELIDARNRQLTATTAGGSEAGIRFDTLIIATGAEPIRPPVPGIDRDGVYQLHTVDDSLVLNELSTEGPSRPSSSAQATSASSWPRLSMPAGSRSRSSSSSLPCFRPSILRSARSCARSWRQTASR
jgi:hypothetical protein